MLAVAKKLSRNAKLSLLLLYIFTHSGLLLFIYSRQNAPVLLTESSSTGCTEVTPGTEAEAAAGRAAAAAGDRATHAGLLDGDTRGEERAEGAAQFPEESQGVYLPPAAHGEDVFTEGAAEFRVHCNSTR